MIAQTRQQKVKRFCVECGNPFQVEQGSNMRHCALHRRDASLTEVRQEAPMTCRRHGFTMHYYQDKTHTWTCKRCVSENAQRFFKSQKVKVHAS